ncbi:MAG: membrane protein insertase YidC [Terracidiphilus sp.]
MPEIRNPNLQAPGGSGGGSGGDMRSMMAFFLLMLVVLLGYQYFFKPQQPEPAPASQSQSQSQPAQTASQPATPGQPAQPQTAAGSVQAPPATPTVAAALETETTVENEEYKIVFTNRGAQVKHWILKKYSDTAGKPLDMVQPQASEKFGFPLSLFTYEPALNEELNKKALYQLTASGAQPSVTGYAEVPATNALTFHYAANGLDVVKTFRFDASYVITVEAEVKRNGEPVRALVQWPAGLGDMEEFVPSSQPRSQVPISASSLFAWSLEGKQNSIAAKKVSGNATLDQPYEYAAITDLYFAAAFLPGAPERTTLVTLHNSIDIDMPGSMTNSTAQKRPADVIGLAVGDASGTTRLRLYAGPKQLDLLKTIHATGADGKPTGQSLEPLIQFGWMTIIAKPLYLALRFLRGLLGPGAYNWGWAIIIVTSLFTLLMLPTRFMMLKSSLKMMRIQPKVDAIKQRYANLKATDPKRANMNAEMMELYKVEGVNMYGSCLPMLVQMPLFIAYYQVLRNAVELRQAHWFWLTDLSVADPSHVLPILIILTMFFTQYITPSPGMDAAQRRMMAFMMPVVMGFVLWSLPSGLALYWGTSNIINLALQIGINQSHIGKEMNAIAAKRAVKKAGVNPKTIQGRR